MDDFVEAAKTCKMYDIAECLAHCAETLKNKNYSLVDSFTRENYEDFIVAIEHTYILLHRYRTHSTSFTKSYYTISTLRRYIVDKLSYEFDPSAIYVYLECFSHICRLIDDLNILLVPVVDLSFLYEKGDSDDGN